MAAASGAAEPATDVGCVPVGTAGSRVVSTPLTRGRRGLDEVKSEGPPGEMEALRKMVAEFSEALRQEREERIEALAERDAAWDAKLQAAFRPQGHFRMVRVRSGLSPLPLASQGWTAPSLPSRVYPLKRLHVRPNSSVLV